LRREIENALEGSAVSREDLREIYAKLRGLSVAVEDLYGTVDIKETDEVDAFLDKFLSEE
jgi:hypothetical protein